MARRFEQYYRMKDGETRLGETYFNAVFRDLDLRLHTQEEIEKTWKDAISDLNRNGLRRIDEFLVPAYERIADLTELGFLNARLNEDAPVTFRLGEHIVILKDGVERDLFQPSPYVVLSVENNEELFAVGRVIQYDRESGALRVDIVSRSVGLVGNEGPHYGIHISASAGSMMATLQLAEEVRNLRDQSEGDASKAQTQATIATEKAAAAAESEAQAKTTVPVRSTLPPSSPIEGKEWIDDEGRHRTWIVDGNGVGAWVELFAARVVDNPALVDRLRSDIIALLGAEASAKAYRTFAALDADKAHPENTTAYVLDDPDQTKNGLYIKSGAAHTGMWEKSKYQPASVNNTARNYRDLASLQIDTSASSGTLSLVVGDADAANDGWYEKVGEPGSGYWKKTDAAAAAAVSSLIGTGNVFKTSKSFVRAEANNGGEIIRENGITIGMRIPAGETGALTYLTAAYVLSDEDRARLKGRTIRLTAVASVTPGYDTDKAFRQNRAGQIVLSGGGVFNVGVLIGDAYSEGKVKRTIEYTVQGTESDVGVLFSTPPEATPAATDHEMVIEDLRMYVVREEGATSGGTSAEEMLADSFSRMEIDAAESVVMPVGEMAGGWATLQNGAQVYPLGSSNPSAEGLIIPAGQTGAGSLVFQLFDIPKEVVTRLAGATIRITAKYKTSHGFSKDVPHLRVSGMRAARNGSSSVGVPATLVSLHQVGEQITRVVDYVVDAGDERIGFQFTIPVNNPVSSVEHFVALEYFSWTVVKSASDDGDNASTLRFWALLNKDLPGAGEIVSLKERADSLENRVEATEKDVLGGLIVSGNVMPEANPTGGVDSNGAVLIYEGGKIVGVRYPAGVSGAGGYIRVLYEFPDSVIETLVGRTIRMTVTAEVSPTFEVDKPLRSDRAIYDTVHGNVGTLVSADFSGTTYRRVVEWTVPSGAKTFGPTLSYVLHTVSENDNWFRVKELTWAVYGDGQSIGEANSILIDWKIQNAVKGGMKAAPLLAPTVEAEQTESLFDQPFTPVIQAFTLKTPGSAVTTPKGTVSFDAPETVSVIDHPFTMIAAPSGGAIPGARLPHQYISDYTVKRVSDGAILVEGEDYAVKENTPYIYGLKDLPNFACTISYTGHLHRYDYLSANPATGALTVTNGTERAIDPEEYKPSLPSGNVLLNTVYVNRHGTDLLQSWRYRNLRDLHAASLWQEWLEYCRACLPKTLAKLRTGHPIRIIGYGSSSVDMGAGGASQLVPNGPRDRASFFDRIPADTRAKYPLYDGTDPDFLGSPYSDHIKWGFVWQLIFAMRERWGASVEYRNWGVGGTNSQNVIDGNGRMGGLYPDRLNAMLSDGGDLMVLAFANGLGGAWQYQTHREIIEAFKASGGEVIVLTTPRLNSYGGSSPNDTTWLHTHDQLVRAAIDTESAYVSTYMLEGPGREGNTGLSPKNMTNGNLFNHGGPVQIIGIGKHLASIIP